MVKKKNLLIFSGLIFFTLITNSNSLENKILVKIENQIITSLDVNNEYKYLVALNPSIKNSKVDRKLKYLYNLVQFQKKNKNNKILIHFFRKLNQKKNLD